MMVHLEYMITETKQELIELIEVKNREIEHSVMRLQYNNAPDDSSVFLNILLLSMAKKMVYEYRLAKLEQQILFSE